ncbi:ganglioside GM2 activator-like [Daphnia pulicaria]|uniref:ganglioside GM2 activator-like n=1 Tax=Daphnia pulicaria TaxID=35523 RepID=UPI001EEB22FD|nr:ganglioside GM2 activator-like [Daphnia pulicaria]
MDIRCAFYVLFFFVTISNGLGRFESTSRYLMQVIRRLDEKITTVEVVELQKQGANLKLKQFDWVTCSGPDALAHINELDISDPLSIPGNITITVDSVLSSDVQSPLKVAVRVQKKVGFFWIDVPCIDNVGSCDYEDLCAIIPFPPGEPCPEPFLSLNLPCNCPVSKGDYVLKNKLVHIPDEHIPQFLARGQYSVQVQASMNSQEVVCFQSKFALV